MNALNTAQPLARLVVQAQQGNKQAFEALFLQTHRLARKIAYSVLGDQLAEDAVQESFILVYRKLPQLADPEAFRGWLSRLVLHTAYRLASTRREQVPLLAEDLIQQDESHALVDTLHLRQGLARLKRADREILVLRELLGLSYGEVAYALELPVGTVRSRLHSARKHLAKRLAL